jgi:peptide/nickel transport system substrate-binding protein
MRRTLFPDTYSENIFVISPTSFFIQFKNNLLRKIYSFTKKEFAIFIAFVIVVIFGLIGFINSISNSFAVQTPTYGGTLREGILGTPRFINPILATSDIDQDLSKIVYSGLMRRIATPDNTETLLVPDLAESYTVSDDGKVYTFILRDKAVFHDKKPVTAEDVVFTITTAQDSRFQSPQYTNWFGVNVVALDAKTIQITLPRPFSGFLDTATLGILPKHIWGSLSAEEFLANNKNNIPVGSGPYKVKDIDRDKNGIPTAYTLTAFKKFTLQKPYIQKFIISLYPNEEALLTAYQKGAFDMIGNIRPYEITKENTRYTVTSQLPRMFGLFLNPTRNDIFKDASLRSLLEQAIINEEIITTVFQGYAQSINHPIPELTQDTPNQRLTSDVISSRLDAMGWKADSTTGVRMKNGKKLSFVMSTADTAELKYTGQIIQKQLRDIGVETELQVFQLSDLENSVIKNRSFDALLFGQFIRNDADLYAFWHSTQLSDPGLNITQFANKTLDTTLEKLFETTESEKRTQLLNELNKELANAPVIWIYQPQFIYALRHPVYGIHLQSLISKNDRFSNIYQWYVQTDTVWKFLNK